MVARRPVPVPDMGTFHRQLEEPEVVGEISAAEAKEIKTLNDLQERLVKDAQHAQRVMQVAGMHRMEFLRNLITQRGLPIDDLYNVDDDTGQIKRTHELVKPQREVVEDEPAP
jgi:hypothetical protein